MRKDNGGELIRDSIDSLRSPALPKTPTLTNVPEENSTFAIGDDDDDDTDTEENHHPDPPRSPLHSPSAPSAPSGTSRSASIASSIDESVPLQLRGMSEKARGKRPVGQPAFSRQSSTTSLSNAAVTTPALGGNEFFTPSSGWVSTTLFDSDEADMDTRSKAGYPNSPSILF